MKGNIFALGMSLCALAVLSCNKQPKVEETPIEINLSISPSELSFTSENEVLFLEVETNASDTELSDNLSWLVIDKVEGGFNVEALENTSIDARSGELIVYAIEGNERETMNVKVTQAGAGAKAQFKDPEFRRLMLAYCDADGDGIISQAEADRLTEMDLTYDSEASDRSVIKSLDGIKIFRNLKNLECDFNALTSLDLSGMDKLEYLSCTYNKISSLNLKGCTSLVQFYANVNELTALDLSDSDNLKFVQAYKNRIETFELTGKKQLGYLDISQNALTSLKVEDCPELGIVNCGSNNLTTLGLKNLPKLFSLGCYGNSLTSVSVKEFPELLLFECYDNNITSLDLSECPTLGSIRCSNNLIEELLLPEVKKGLVTYVVCDGNRIKSLDLSSYPNLKAVNCGTNLLESLNVAGCSKIETLSCEKNCLTTLSLEGLAAMTSLVCSDNSIKELNVTESPLLEKVDAQRNPLESLWITAEQKSSIKEIKTDNNDNIVKVWRNAPVLTVSVAELAFGDGAEERKITYSIENPVEGESLQFTPSASWLTVKDLTENSFVVCASKNTESEARTATLKVAYANAEGSTITVSQEAAKPLSFEVNLTKVWYESASFSVTPSDPTATYIAYTRPKSKVDSFASDEDLIKADIERFMEWGTIATSGNFYSGAQELTGAGSRWISKDYYVVVYGLTADGNRTTDKVIKIPFTLSSVKPSISVGEIPDVPKESGYSVIPVSGGTYTVSYTIENERDGEDVTVESLEKKWLHINSVDKAAHTITFTVDECTQISYSYPYKREGSFIIYHADASPCTLEFRQNCPKSSN